MTTWATCRALAAGPGEPVRVWEFGTALDEAQGVVAEIRRLHDALGERWGDIAVSIRNFKWGSMGPTHKDVQDALLEAGVPYVVGRCTLTPG